MTNKNLILAKKNRNDEFYTDGADIQKECQLYSKQFKNKVIYCNCDDANKSKFFAYFMSNFKVFGIKKLICTCYKENSNGFCVTYDGKTFFSTNLKGNGDFRSEECINFLQESDMVVTNPPFSLFRDFISLLEQYNKKYLVVGNSNAITYSEVFPLIRDNKMRLGYNLIKHFVNSKGEKKSFGNICWFTNLKNNKQNVNIPLHKHYNEKEYQTFDNYNAINVNRVNDIPLNYNGIIGVPISFLHKYNSKQFEIVGCSCNCGRPKSFLPETKMSAVINGREIYKRLLIKAR